MKKFRHRKPEETDAQTDELIGLVKKLMQVRYKAHKRKDSRAAKGKIEADHALNSTNFIVEYNKAGFKTHEELFGKRGQRTIHTYNDKQLLVETIEFYSEKIYSTTTLRYNERNQLLEYSTRYEKDNSTSRMVHNYDEDGRPLSYFHFWIKEGKEILNKKEIWTYDEAKRLLSHIDYDGDGKINHQHIYIYENGRLVEKRSEWTDKKMDKYSDKQIYTYDKEGYCIKNDCYLLDGTLKYSQAYEYIIDRDGKRIPKPNPAYIPPEEKETGETEELEKDVRGNWIKKTTFYNGLPLNIYERELVYFDDPDKNLIHPMSNLSDNDVVEDSNEEDGTQFAKEEAQWLAEGALPNESFSALRYYVLVNRAMPSVVTYTASAIEPFALFDELKDNMGAKEVHSTGHEWNNNGTTTQRCTLSFPNPHYLLSLKQFQRIEEDEFTVPDFIHDYATRGDGSLYTCFLELLLPSDASGNRDKDFEAELEEYIQKCTLKKKPDQPVIYMIETAGNSFVMRDHPVNDGFEIKDLDVNYGYGFKKFHQDLMQRFQTQSKGLVLFHGEPGTGKTFYIRHLLKQMAVSKNKAVIYMPPNMVDHLVEPAFMTFLTGEIQEFSEDGFFCVLLIEDAEPLLAKRQEGVRIQGVTNLLNMTDGLLNDMLKLQIICTFNVDLKKLDSALLRPGRLIARKEFKKLDEISANLLAQRLGIKHTFKTPASLGEIYSLMKDQNTLIHDVERGKGASNDVIDDL